MVNKAVLGVLAIITLASGGLYVTMNTHPEGHYSGNQAKIGFTQDSTNFYVPNSDVPWFWSVTGKETIRLMDGSSVLQRDVSNIQLDMEIDEEKNLVTFTRITPYKAGPVRVDVMVLNGSNKDIEKFPLNQTIYFYNASGYFLRYSIDELREPPEKHKLDGETEVYLGDNMKVSLEPDYRWGWFGYPYGEDSFSVQYEINSNSEEFNIRLFDPLSVTKDEVFTKLISSKADLTYGEAVFEINNPFGKLNADKLSHEYTIAKGNTPTKTLVFINTTLTREESTYTTEYVNRTCMDNKTKKEFECGANHTYPNGTKTIEYEGWKQIKDIPSGRHKIKVRAEWPARLGEQKIDWIPKLTVPKELSGADKDTLLRQDKWAWWSSSWLRAKTINLTHYTATPTEYQTCFVVTYDSDMQADFDDLRFTDNDNATLLDAFLTDKTDSTNATICVEVNDSITSSGTLITMYYSNGAASDYWDIEALAINNVGDDFDDDSINWTKWSNWTKGGYDEVSESGGIFVIDADTDNYDTVGIYSQTGIGASGIGWTARIKKESERYSFFGLGNITSFDGTYGDGLGPGGYVVGWDADRNRKPVKFNRTSFGSDWTTKATYNVWQNLSVAYLSNDTFCWDADGDGLFSDDDCDGDSTYNSTNKSVFFEQHEIVDKGENPLKFDWIFARKVSGGIFDANYTFGSEESGAGLNVELNHPSDTTETTNESVWFNLTATSMNAGSITNCTLYADWNVSWGANETIYPTNATENGSYLKVPVGTHLWGYLCYSNGSDYNSTTANRTITVGRRIIGTAKDGDSNAIDNATVYIIEQSNDTVMNTTNANSTGDWSVDVWYASTFLVTGYEDDNSSRDGDVKPHVVVS